jgi:hypothetical protein
LRETGLVLLAPVSRNIKTAPKYSGAFRSAVRFYAGRWPSLVHSVVLAGLTRLADPASLADSADSADPMAVDSVQDLERVLEEELEV